MANTFLAHSKHIHKISKVTKMGMKLCEVMGEGLWDKALTEQP